MAKIWPRNMNVPSAGSIAFYMRTTAYRSIVALHGGRALPSKLSQMARQGEWAGDGQRDDRRHADAFAVAGTWAETSRASSGPRYAGRLLDRVASTPPYTLAMTNAGLAVVADGPKGDTLSPVVLQTAARSHWVVVP